MGFVVVAKRERERGIVLVSMRRRETFDPPALPFPPGFFSTARDTFEADAKQRTGVWHRPRHQHQTTITPRGK